MAFEYSEFKVEDQRETVRNELRSYEQQHAARAADVEKFSQLIAAHDRGDFAQWDKRILVDRVRDWGLQRSSAHIDVASMELLIANAKERLKALGGESAAE